MSREIYKKVKNQSKLEFEELGSFEFKNVEEPISVFALANEGMNIPNLEKLEGKFKTSSTAKNSSFFQKIWSKNIPQILIAYLLIAWVSMQLFDWALMQFGISPHWAQIFFITVIGIIPSLLVYLNNKERIKESKLNLSEKILFPTNFAVIGIVLFSMFKSVDLGAVSKNITFVNADGEEETHNIIKAEFKKQFPIYPFEPIGFSDSINNYIGLAAPNYLGYFLNQDKYLSIGAYLLSVKRARDEEYYTTVEKINNSKLYNDDFYVDGKYEIKDGGIKLIPAIRNKVNGNLIIEKTFSGTNLNTVADSVVSFIRNNVGLTDGQISESLVLNFSDIVSNNVDAVKEFGIGLCLGNSNIHNEKAIELDSTYVHPHLSLAMQFTRFSEGKLESKILIDRAVRHMKNLPFIEQIGIRIQKHLIYGEWEKAEQLLRLQLEIEPENEDYNFMLSNLYLKTFQKDKYIEQAEHHYAINPSIRTGNGAIRAAFMKGEPELVIDAIQSIIKRDPQNIWALQNLAEAYLHQEEYDLAQETINKIILINPDTELNLSKTLEAISYLKVNGNSKEHLSLFTGDFRFDHLEMMINTRIVGDNLYTKAENQGGFFMYSSGKNQIQRGGSGKGFKDALLFNEKNEVYAQKVIESYDDREYTAYRWKQDSVIWKAESFLQNGKYEEAYEAYKIALNRHPEHYYLEQALQHLVYLRTHTEEEVINNFQRFVGDYGPRSVWLEDGLLYYKREGQARRILRPISKDRFMQLSVYNLNFEFVEENGEIVGLRSYRHDFEKKEWSTSENGYTARTILLN